MSVPSKRPGAITRFVLGIRFRLAVTFTFFTLIGLLLALRIVPRPDDRAFATYPPSPIAFSDSSASSSASDVPNENQPLPSRSAPPATAPVHPPAALNAETLDRKEPSSTRSTGFAWVITSKEAPSTIGGATYSVPAPAAPERFAIRPYLPQPAGQIPNQPGVPRPRVQSRNEASTPQALRRASGRTLIPDAEFEERSKARRSGGSGESAVWAVNVNGTRTVDIGTVLGAGAFTTPAIPASISASPTSKAARPGAATKH